MGATTAMIGGTLVSAQGMRLQGEQAKVAANINAQQADKQGGQAMASAQRGAMEEARRSRILQSRALAIAAAGGGSASDPTAQKIIGDIAGAGAYQSMVSLYEGESKARAFHDKATVASASGEIAKLDGDFAATARTFTGLSRVGISLYDKYGAGGPPGKSAPIESRDLQDINLKGGY